MTKQRTLGPISAQFVNSLQRKGKEIFSLIDAMNVYPKSRDETAHFIKKLVNRGVVARLNSGVYLLLQPGQETTQLSNWPIIADALTASNAYFISYYSAMRLHGMTTHALIDVYVTLTKKRREKTVNRLIYHFINIKPEHFWGETIHWVRKQTKVMVSDIERTILDGLDRPSLCGGIIEVVKGIWVKQKEIDWARLSEYANRFHSKASVKRLGFILERLELGSEYLFTLKNIINEAKDYIFFDPEGEKNGKHFADWYIRMNINIDELKIGVWG